MPPCWEANVLNLEFNLKSIDLLKEALDSLDLSYTVRSEGIIQIRASYSSITLNLNKGMATMEERHAPLLNRIRRAYSEKAVEKVAKKKKWIMKKKSNKIQIKKY